MQMPFSVHPSLASKVAEERLAHLLVPGKIEDHDLDLRISRLDRLFHCYATSITHGLWVPGLVITHEMQAFAELLFPLDRIIPVFNRFFAKQPYSHRSLVLRPFTALPAGPMPCMSFNLS
ncbi:hypothetical protein [Geotalea toluenoxydans]|uniref:hypothetical protein n=1 Tax=Geotalea toluenoxydans TaxID=421624 RepID=UPI0006D24806|nr:hypothetical protein [Geotalea toluenoxydans]